MIVNSQLFFAIRTFDSEKFSQCACMLGRFSCVQLFVTLWNPTRLFCPWVLQARILEWVSLPSSGKSSPARDGTLSPAAPTMQADY